MENKLREIMESIVYIFLIVLVIFASVYGSIYIRLIPLLFILGIVGNLVFKRQVLTTILGLVVALCINYLKTPSDIFYVLFISASMCLNIILGEAFGKIILKLISSIKEKKNYFDKKNILFSFAGALLVILELTLHNYANGSIVSYQECRKNLKEYLKENYSNYDRFKEINVSYYAYKNPRYIFYLSNMDVREISKFTVYVNEDNMIIDEYKDLIQNNNISKINDAINSCVVNLEDSSKYDDLNIKVKYSFDDKVCLEISKKVENVDEISTNDFSREVAEFLEDISLIDVYKNIYEIDLSIKSKTNLNEGLASIVYLQEYNAAIEDKSDIAYKYVLKSLNMEYEY